jgi:hypothetical protein
MDPAAFAAHFQRIRQWKEAQVRAIQEKKEPHQRSEDGFLARLAKKVRDSLEIRIRNFRIRYADRRSTADGVSGPPLLSFNEIIAVRWPQNRSEATSRC